MRCSAGRGARETGDEARGAALIAGWGADEGWPDCWCGCAHDPVGAAMARAAAKAAIIRFLMTFPLFGRLYAEEPAGRSPTPPLI